MNGWVYVLVYILLSTLRRLHLVPRFQVKPSCLPALAAGLDSQLFDQLLSKAALVKLCAGGRQHFFLVSFDRLHVLHWFGRHSISLPFSRPIFQPISRPLTRTGSAERRQLTYLPLWSKLEHLQLLSLLSPLVRFLLKLLNILHVYFFEVFLPRRRTCAVRREFRTVG